MDKIAQVKKYAMILMNEEFDAQHVQIDVPGIEHHVFTVCSPQQAMTLVTQLADDGFGAIEVCGAFGEALANQMQEAIDHKVSVGYVVYPAQQEAALQRFWQGENREEHQNEK